MFNLANLEVSWQQCHLVDNLQAEVIIPVLDRCSRVGVRGTGRTEVAGPGPTEAFWSHLAVTEHPAGHFVEDERRQWKGEGVRI